MTQSIATSLVSTEELRAAAAALRGIAVRTPLLPSDALEAQAGVPVWLKPEMLQRAGAFKFRGAYHYMNGLSDAARARGVVAPSSGNHGQAVAMAARMFGVPATVVMPVTAPKAKRLGAERLGARVFLHGVTTAERMERARELCRDEGLTLVPPYDHRTIIAGQGTIGMEIVEDCPGVGTVIVPVGGGGLSAGVAAAVKLIRPQARVIVVEPEGSPKYSAARSIGRPVSIDPNPDGLADGLLAVRIGDQTFAHLQAYADDVVQVPDRLLPCAVQFLLERHKVLAEPSGAITVAALLDGRIKASGPTVAVLSGGNIEYEGLRALLGDA